MRALILYRPSTEQEGKALDYQREYTSRHPGKNLEMFDVNTKAGTEMAELYGIVRFPAVVLISDDGKLVQLWQDEFMPLIDEVYAYMV